MVKGMAVLGTKYYGLVIIINSVFKIINQHNVYLALYDLQRYSLIYTNLQNISIQDHKTT